MKTVGNAVREIVPTTTASRLQSAQLGDDGDEG
jgi:hypothetical protein